MYGVDAENGTLLWKHSLGSPVAASVSTFRLFAELGTEIPSEIGVVAVSQAGCLQLLAVSQVINDPASETASARTVSCQVRQLTARQVHADCETVKWEVSSDLREIAGSDSDDTDLHSSSAERKVGEIFASPVIAQGCIYVGSRDDCLYCFEPTEVIVSAATDSTDM